MTASKIYSLRLLAFLIPLFFSIPIEVSAQCQGGMVAMPSGATMTYTCPGDGNADIVKFTTTSTAATAYAYVVTDDQNVILGLPPADSLDFEGAGTGVCRVWGLSYTGVLNAMMGQNAATATLATGCFELSTNFITVVRDNPDGGTVSMPSGATRRYTCPGDGVADIVKFVNTSTSNAQFRYVVTDDQNVILGLPPADSLDFEGAGTGICRVWGLSYTGQFTGMVGQNAATAMLSNDCFELSTNFITVVRDNPDGGTVSMPSGATRRYTCPGDGVADIVKFVNTSTSNAQFRYVVTDDQNVILGLPPADSLDFEGAGTGICRVWGLSYTGQFTGMVGQNAATAMLSNDCFELSTNFITVVRDNPDGGTVSMPSGATRRYTCPGDGVADIVKFVNTSTSNAQFRYVVTDDQNVILGLPPADSLDFEGAGTGICRVWGLSYTGQFTGMVGQNAATAMLSNDCFELSTNFITVVRDNPDGGTVSMPSGATRRYTCPGDGVADIVKFVNTSTSNAQFRYVVTDDQNVILGLPPADSLDFEGAGTGICRVWGLSYTGQFTGMVGQNAATAMLSNDCFELSTNFITVVRDNPDGGTVSMPSGATRRYTCPGDGVADIVKFVNTSTSNAQFRYVVTDDQNVILGLPPADSLDFEGAGTGICRVWGLSYTGQFTGMVGQNAATAMLSNDCFELSTNFITVVRDNPDGGTVSMPSGATRRYTCPGDGVADIVKFVNTSTSNAQFRYVVTDDQNVILGLPPADSLDFEGAGIGICRVWGLSYTGQFTGMVGQNAATAMLSNDCFELSTNFITVVRDNPDGGTVSMPSGATRRYTCPGDGVADIVKFVNTSTSNAQFRYVVTDDQNVILGLPPADSLDFEGAGTGICRVWGLSYTGQFTGMVGQNAATAMLSNDCFELSTNFITVVRDNPDGGTVSMPSGATRRYTCPGDGVADIVKFVNTSTSNAQFRYVVTDDQNVILGLPPADSLDFEGAGTGICRVWGLSYTGQFTGMVGQNAATAMLSNDCFELSTNFITVVRDNPDGGTVSMPSGATRRYTCPGDGVADIVKFVNTSTSNAQFRYVVTDDQNVILGLPPADSLDFEGAGTGICRVWGLSYTGQLTAMMGQNAATATLADNCFELSTNFIEVVRVVPDGGMITSGNGNTMERICVNGSPDPISFMTSSTSDAMYQFIVTDDNGNILAIPPVTTIDFDGAGAGICRVYGISFVGTLNAVAGQNISTVTASTCFDLSSNWLTINRESDCQVEICDIDDFQPGNATAFAVLLDGITGAPGKEYRFDSNGGTLITYDDGTANVTGTIELIGNTNYSWEVNVWFQNRRDWTAWSALGRNYKGGRPAAIQNHPNWDYYEFDVNQAYLVGVAGSALAGDTITLTPNPSNYQYGFQKGLGANDKNGNFGASTWFNFAGSHTGFGDFNFSLTCNMAPRIPVPNLQFQTAISQPLVDDLSTFVYDPEGGNLNFGVAPVNSLTGQSGMPQFGTLNLQNSGQFVYSPQIGFQGLDGFRFRAFDNGTPAAFVEGAVDIAVGSNVFPVTWVSFTAEKLSEIAVELNWATSDENNNDHFVIEKSIDLDNFQAISQVEAQNASGIQSYQFVDRTQMAQQTYYRLKQVDLDGGHTYSSVIEVNFGTDLSDQIILYPNPVENSLFVYLPEGKFSLTISDLSGKIINQRTSDVNFAADVISLSTENLSAGTYLLTVEGATGERTIKRFIKK